VIAFSVFRIGTRSFAGRDVCVCVCAVWDCGKRRRETALLQTAVFTVLLGNFVRCCSEIADADLERGMRWILITQRGI
jgi:hypothetical protein